LSTGPKGSAFRRLLYRGTVEWGLFRQMVGELVAGPEVSHSELMEGRLRDPGRRELRVT
jgi:hypothetical protein